MTPRVSLVCLALALAAMGQQAPTGNGAPSSAAVTYEVRLEKLDSVEVSIHFPSAPATLRMATGGTGSDAGFAGYVRDLKLTCGQRQLPAVRTGATWKTDAGDAVGPCSASYRMDLSFARSKWEVGNEQAGFTDDRGTFLSTKAIFLESSVPGPRIVRFERPPNWRLVTSWDAQPDGSFVFAEDGMLKDILAFGELNVSTVGAPLHAQIVTFGALRRDAQQAAKLLNDSAAAFNAIFPDSPPTNFLVVLLPGAEADGEAYANGFASTLAVPLDPDMHAVWGDTIAHEVFHHWCGGLIKADEHAAMEWFTEGFTEYFANLALMRSHEISADDFLQKMAVNIGQYEYFLDSSLFNDVTIEKAGLHKGRNRFGVYAGGWVMAFILDQEIRNASGGRRSLEEVMRALLAQTKDAKLTPAMLFATVQSVGGQHASELLQRGIGTRESLHPGSYLPPLGLKVDGQSYQAEFYVRIDRSADNKSRQRRQAWAGF